MIVAVLCLLIFSVEVPPTGSSSISFPALNGLKGNKEDAQFASAIAERRFPEVKLNLTAMYTPQTSVRDTEKLLAYKFLVRRTNEQHYLVDEDKGIGAVRRIAETVLKVLDHDAVRSSPRNWVVSPLSLTAVIAQLLLGSRGRLQSTLVDSLALEKGVKPISKLEVHRQLGPLMKFMERRQNESYTLELNSAIFIQPGIHLKPTYKHALLDFYNVQIYPLDFMGAPMEATKKINDWVNQSTHGKLPELFMYPLPESTCSIMANAVYFNGRWEMPFYPDYTTPGTFHISETEKVEVDFMFGEKEVLYTSTPTLQLIGIPYKGWEVVFYVLLPYGKLDTSLTVSYLDQLISTARRENITLVIPKLKLLSTISVRQSVLKYIMKSERQAIRTVILSRKGIPEAREEPPQDDDSIFDDVEQFDVGGASEDARFKIDDVIHQVSMQVDEVGSEIAAVTAGLIDYSGDNFLLKIDRPFWFFIRHELSCAHLFWGRIVNPSRAKN